MKSPKKPFTLRLSEDTIKEITEISKREKVSQSDVITVLIHLYYTSGDIDAIEEWFNIVRMS